MKRLIIIAALLCVVGALTACRSTNDSTPEATAEKTSTWDGDAFERTTDKILAGEQLTPEEWQFLFDNIEYADGCYSEGIGSALYTSLKDNALYNSQLAANLNLLPPERQEHILEIMMVCMSIDLMCDEEHYSWPQFVEKFPAYNGHDALEEVMEGIYDEE